MRILFVSGLTGFASGGVVTEMCRLIAGMRDRGAEVAFVIDRLPPALEGIKHFPIKYPPTKTVGEKIKSAVDEFRPEWVHLVGGGLSVLRPLNSMRLKIPWILTAHNVPPFEQISSWFFGHNRLYYLVRNARALPTTIFWKQLLRNGTFVKVIAHSQTVADHLQEYGCQPGKISLIPLGCEAPIESHSSESSPFPPDAFPKIMTVAGYAHHKGIHDYIEASALLVKEYPRLAYRIIGNSRNQKYTRFLQGRIEALHLAANVELLRSADDATKRAALSAADLYVQPSHEEGFCLAFAEAAMVSPRLIGCRTGEIAGLSNNAWSARLVSPRRVEELVNATTHILAHDASPDEISLRAKNLLLQYSWESYLKHHEALFSSAH